MAVTNTASLASVSVTSPLGVACHTQNGVACQLYQFAWELKVQALLAYTTQHVVEGLLKCMPFLHYCHH